MSRYISKLPPEIRELAEKRRKEQNPESKEDNLGNIKSFNWSKTPERSNFWNDIYQSNYSLFYTLYPQKDKLDELIDILENRIKELKHADSEFCKDRWDMSKPEFERNIYREQSNNVTFARQEIETILNKAKEIKGK